MPINIIDSVKGLLSSDLLNKAAGMLGENPANVQRAVGGIIPTIFTGVLNKAGSGEAQGILGMATDAMKHGIPENLTALVSGGGLLSKGGEMLKNLFGEKTAAISSAVAGYSGISGASASTLMNMAAPAALGVLGKQAADANLGPSGLLSFLHGQKDNILGAVPSGLNLPSLLGIGSLSAIGSKLSGLVSTMSGTARTAVSPASATAEKGRTGNRWLLPLILLLVVIAIIWYFMSRHNPTETAGTVTDSAATMKDTTMAPAMINVTLPNGTELDAYPGGIEDQLVRFLNDPNSKPGKDVWFDFDKLNFNTGSAVIIPESMNQLNNIALILKAFPKAKIKIGGYTDRTGDSVGNQKLSEARAISVAEALKADGANAAQITDAEGYGSAFAKADVNGSEQDKMKDRHISVSVREK
jgi:outer membrane protein OmpA-like peptidoglycan-associated protein